ncbi:hypothetical protein COO60DRAFT_192009 [Scenedesmus sp. NREL 46B-D3]|nr:hypothetical protein COO60DRAFT_192009 [Scenedesmus sp. NREL 46B-D3]
MCKQAPGGMGVSLGPSCRLYCACLHTMLIACIRIAAAWLRPCCRDCTVSFSIELHEGASTPPASTHHLVWATHVVRERRCTGLGTFRNAAANNAVMFGGCTLAA